jgi:GGDEF domain-containing protein
MSAPAVLLVNCPPALEAPVRKALLAADMLTDLGRPEVLLWWLDLWADDASEQVEGLRAEHRRSSPVIIGLITDETAAAVLRAAEIGLDEVVASDAAELIAARSLLAYRARTRFAQASPLTGLPGAGALEREINARLPHRGRMALLAFDVDHFKSYNDRYGYQRGDGLLRHLWVCLEQALQAAPRSFLAHLGGDDFFALVRPAEMPAVAQRAIELFEAGRNEYYDPDDLARGAIISRTRSGELAATPLATLTVAAVTNEPEDLQHSGQLAAVLAELKAHGKRLEGSNFVPDRRQVHSNEAAWVSRQQQARGTED